MERRPICQTLHGLQVMAVRLDSEHRAGLNRLAVEQDRARAAARGVAADMGAGQPQILSDEMDQQQPGLDLGAVCVPLTVTLTGRVSTGISLLSSRCR